MIIVGITGTLGAGKGTLVQFLIDHFGFAHYSVRSFLLKVIAQRGLPPNRDSMVLVGNELRAAHSPSYIVECLYDEAVAAGHNCVIESIRTTGEIDALRKKGRFVLFAVDADPQLRYQRIVARASETDKVSFETFMANEQREMQSNSPATPNLAACMAAADYRFTNNGSYEDLFEQLKLVMHAIEQ